MNRIIPFPYMMMAIISFVMGCHSQNKEPVNEVIVLDSLTPTLLDTISHETLNRSDSFYEALKLFSNEFPNYNSVSANLVDTLDDHTNHWLIVMIEKSRKNLERRNTNNSQRQLKRLPTQQEYETIEQIRQGLFYLTYKRSNDVVLEQWKLKDTSSAERWLVLLRDSLWSSQYTKPPRFQWVEDNILYLISTRSAAQWFEQRDTLTTILCGKTKNQLVNLYDPLDLKYFKKWRGGAHSSPSTDKPHLFTTEKGPHFSYFFFTKHRLTGEDRQKVKMEFTPKQDFHLITTLHNPFTGDEKFDTIKETLAEIQCAINDEALNNLNIVGKDINEVEELFGSVLYQRDSLKVYGHSNRIVVVHVDQNIVKSFKYMRLFDAFDALSKNNDLLNNYILRFDP